jgi:hypothetical protein
MHNYTCLDRLIAKVCESSHICIHSCGLPINGSQLMYAASNARSVDLSLLNKHIHLLITLTLASTGQPKTDQVYTGAKKVNKGMSSLETARLMAPIEYLSKIDKNYEGYDSFA